MNHRLTAWADQWAFRRALRRAFRKDVDEVVRRLSMPPRSRLRPYADRAYLVAHNVSVARVQGGSEFGTCPHAVDQLWNRHVYPLIDRIEVGA